MIWDGCSAASVEVVASARVGRRRHGPDGLAVRMAVQILAAYVALVTMNGA
jgi:hypothetical protein